MVDVGDKTVTVRDAVARGQVRMQPGTLRLLAEGRVEKGDVLAVARIAGIQAAKRTPELIPLCHGIALTGCEVSFELGEREPVVYIEARARAHDRTGVEMEALAAVSVSALTIYDMLKSVDCSMTIEAVGLYEKRGGKSGTWRRDES